MTPIWQTRLAAARSRVVADGSYLCTLLDSPNPHLRRAALDVLASVGWRREQFLDAWYEVLMRENRRG